MDFSEFDAYEHEKRFFRHDRHILRELAELWDPELPVTKNKAYLERAQELERALDTEIAQAKEEHT